MAAKDRSWRGWVGGGVAVVIGVLWSTCLKGQLVRDGAVGAAEVVGASGAARRVDGSARELPVASWASISGAVKDVHDSPVAGAQVCALVQAPGRAVTWDMR